MKIILCTFLLCITAVSVFGKPQELKGILGQSVTFPAAVKEGGSLIHSGVTLGDVTSGTFTLTRNGEYSGRLQWDSSTGLFSLSGLREQDSGEYKVQNTDKNMTVFHLNVYTVSVFGKPQELNRSLGESVKFPAAVKKGGYLMYGALKIGDVTSGSFIPPGNVNYSGRVQWDSSTGFFSLSGLKMEDSGKYNVQNTGLDKDTFFQLNVYIPVSKPHVSITQNESCTIECTAERGTLSWYREGEKKSFASSHVEGALHLHLRQTVESGTYTCEAKNSVSNETASITVGDHCTAPSGFSTWIIVVLSVAVAALIAGVCAVCCCCFRKEIRGFLIRCLRSEGRNIMTSSPQTEVPLNQAKS